MLRSLAVVALLSGCVAPTFQDATDSVNQEFALAVQLRDRCAATGDVEHCLAWHEYREANTPEGSQPATYDRMVARWEANGPY